MKSQKHLKELLKEYGDQFLDLSEMKGEIHPNYLKEKLDSIRRLLLAAAEEKKEQTPNPKEVLCAPKT